MQARKKDKKLSNEYTVSIVLVCQVFEHILLCMFMFILMDVCIYGSIDMCIYVQANNETYCIWI